LVTFPPLQFPFTDNADRLTSPEANASKRIKKRLLQTLGKLKKQLADLKSQQFSDSQTGGRAMEVVVSQNSSEVPHMTRKQKKLKRRIINNELADCAKRKSFKFAYKRFIYALNHG
jgi:hypothetical protein